MLRTLQGAEHAFRPIDTARQYQRTWHEPQEAGMLASGCRGKRASGAE